MFVVLQSEHIFFICVCICVPHNDYSLTIVVVFHTEKSIISHNKLCALRNLHNTQNTIQMRINTNTRLTINVVLFPLLRLIYFAAACLYWVHKRFARPVTARLYRLFDAFICVFVHLAFNRVVSHRQYRRVLMQPKIIKLDWRKRNCLSKCSLLCTG